LCSAFFKSRVTVPLIFLTQSGTNQGKYQTSSVFSKNFFNRQFILHSGFTLQSSKTASSILHHDLKYGVIKDLLSEIFEVKNWSETEYLICFASGITTLQFEVLQVSP
jgi:hypothetical protein